MKQAFNEANFEKLNNLLHGNDTTEADYYRGLMAEYGLHRDRDLFDAQNFYKDAYEGEPKHYKSGLALAKLYIKEGQIDQAKRLLIEIKENKDEKYSKLAFFELTKLRTRQLKGLGSDASYPRALDYLEDNITHFPKATIYYNELMVEKSVLELSLGINKELAIENLKNANDFYKKNLGIKANAAAAELECLKIKEDFIEKGKLKDALRKCGDLIKHYPNCVSAKLIKLKLIENEKDKREEVLKLTREILELEPFNNNVKEIHDKLHETIASDIANAVVDKVIEQSRMDEDALDKLFYTIYDQLYKSDFIKSDCKFSDVDSYASALASRILPIVGQKNFTKDNIDRCLGSVAEAVNYWDQSKQIIDDETLTPEERGNIEKYRDFKEELVKNLEKYYIRCLVITDNDSDVEAKINTNFGDIVKVAAQAAPVVGNAVAGTKGVVLGSLFSGVVGRFVDLGNEAQKAALYRSADLFCQIGDRNVIDARERFEYIADKIIEQYGMQISQVRAGSDVKTLAAVASEKMLDHVRNASVTREMVKGFTNFQESFKYVLGIKSTNDRPQEMVVLEGIRTGASYSSKANVIIETEKRRVDEDAWHASEIFDNPLLTPDGENFYCPQGAKLNPGKYGARFGEKPTEFVQKEISEVHKNTIASQYYNHTKLLDSPALVGGKQKQEKKEEIAKTVDLLDMNAKIRQNKAKRLIGSSYLITGLVLLAGAGLLAASVVSGAIVPLAGLAIVSGLVVGAVSFIKGFKKVSEASEDLQLLYNKKGLSMIDLAREKVRAQRQKENEKKIVNEINMSEALSESIIEKKTLAKDVNLNKNNSKKTWVAKIFGSGRKEGDSKPRLKS
jgi:tetratricopeptide (TPR) repeat protein